jgi:pyridoxal phosphate enzyme (YggS family)
MLAANVETIRQRVARACGSIGRSPDEITIVAVAKTFPADHIRDAVRAGVHDIGENYVQELLRKRDMLAGEDIRWHYVGHLQSNKVRHIVPWVTVIHAVDSVELAREIDRRAGQVGRLVDVLIEVNTTGESSKFGLSARDTPGFIRSLEGFEHLRLSGFMTIGPFLPDPEGSRPMFRALRILRDELAGTGQRNVDLRHLSMGMTGDFEVAIQEGATIIRIGTAIFGPRVKRT